MELQCEITLAVVNLDFTKITVDDRYKSRVVRSNQKTI
jgi:hypothetical protein